MLYLTQHFQGLMRYLTMTKYQSIFRLKEPTSDYFRGLFTKDSAIDPDYHKLVDPEFVEPVKGTGKLEIPNFEDVTSLDAARIIFSSLKKAKQPVPFYFNDVGMWEWLSCIFHEAHPNSSIGHITRYSPSNESGTWNRHLLRTPVWLYEMFQEDSKVYLAKPLHVGGDLIEPWCQTRSVIQKNMMGLLTKLYFDEETQALKKNFKAYTKPGNHRDLLSFIKQLRFTHKVEDMSVEGLLEILPERFDRWNPIRS